MESDRGRGNGTGATAVAHRATHLALSREPPLTRRRGFRRRSPGFGDDDLSPRV